MSLRAPSVLALLGVLQHHGLTYPLLREWVALCQQRHSGQVIVEMAQGRVRSLRAVPSARQRLRVIADDA